MRSIGLNLDRLMLVLGSASLLVCNIVNCSPISAPEPARDPCNPNPCGANADPAVRGNRCECTCRPEYFGDPYSGCRPECVVNSDCTMNKACSR